MKARDVLQQESDRLRKLRRNPRDDGDHYTLTLLAQTPEGEGVYIAPDGTLMGRCDEWPTRHQDHHCDDPDCDGNGWVPIEGADRD